MPPFDTLDFIIILALYATSNVSIKYLTNRLNTSRLVYKHL